MQDLILVDPDDEMEVRAIIAFNGRLQTRFVLDSTPLNEVMALFQASALLHNSPEQIENRNGHGLCRVRYINANHPRGKRASLAEVAHPPHGGCQAHDHL